MKYLLFLSAIMDMDNDWNLYPNFNELRQETKDIHVADKGKYQYCKKLTEICIGKSSAVYQSHFVLILET